MYAWVNGENMNTLVYSFVIIWPNRPLVLMRREHINTVLNFTPSYGCCQTLICDATLYCGYLHLLDNYGILCSQVRCCLCILHHLLKIVLPRAIIVGRIPLVVGKLFCCGCAVCVRNAVPAHTSD